MKITACDGCDKPESEAGEIKHTAVTISTLETVGGVKPDGWDLCVKCGEHLRYVANPTTWPRKVRKPRKAKAPVTGAKAG